jgi:CheY-like chemotaxis protein
MLTKNPSAPLNTIMLVDDNQADNMIHRRILQKMNIAKNVVDFLYAEDALAYLKSPEGKDADLIFLDINMPQMNGFEFLDEFKKLKTDPDDLPAVIMLSTLNPNWDEDASQNYPLIKHFFTKPLTEKFVNSILESVG